jgi:PadR family transcriptional regulator, regulatory protein AphA
MSLTYALLGLISVAPASGYELAKEFDGELGRYAWQAGHASIYPELARLAERGLVKVVDEGPRGRRTYDITPEGREELRTWLLSPPARKSVVRSEAVLRAFLISTLEPADARKMLESIAERYERAATELRAELSSEPTSRLSRAGFGRITAEFGLRQYDALHGWARWALERIPEGRSG